MSIFAERDSKAGRVVSHPPWLEVRLGDVAKTSSGGTPKRTVSAYYSGNIPWVKSGELGDSTVYETSETISKAGLEGSSAKIFPKGTLCVALYGATVGKLGILGVDAATNQAVCGIFLPPEIDTRFAYRFLEAKRRQLVESAKGGAQPNISQEIIRDLRFPIPPLPEQRRIVAEIEKQFTRLEAGVAALKRLQANLKRYRTAVLKAACEGHLVPQDPHDEPVSDLATAPSAQRLQPISDEEIPFRLPNSWRWCRLGRVAELINGDRGKNYPNRAEYVSSGLPFINTGHIEPNGTLSLETMHYLTRAKFDSLRSGKIRRSDLVYCLRGATLGKTAIVDQFSEGAVASSLVIIRLSEKLIPRFAYYYLTSRLGRDLIKRFDNGSAQPNLSANSVKRYVAPIPPLAEQKRIVAEVEQRLSVVEELEAAVSASLQRASRLRQSILQKAFSGRLA